jgi:hypothetical protein
MPWFPVAGNHDIYWRGADKPAGEHEADYEANFGPLWYSFTHKRCGFVVLYSDEGNAESGKRDFSDPACQRISEAQFRWLEDTLQRLQGQRHVFVFLHHPRWITSRYADTWERVHALLARAGNVTAVFAGHIHRMRFDGRRDGIQYFTVASVGAYLEMEAPQAGYLHQYHVVTVRPEGIQVAAIPVGAVIDPRQITGAISEAAETLHRELRPIAPQGLEVDSDGSARGELATAFRNPTALPIEVTVLPTSPAPWNFTPDHQHLRLAAGEQLAVRFLVSRPAGDLLQLTLPRLEVQCELLADGLRIAVPRREFDLDLPAPRELPAAAGQNGVLALDGKDACLELASQHLQLPDGPLTVEAFVRASRLGDRNSIVAKTENSEFGLHARSDRLLFLCHLGGKYAEAESQAPVLRVGQWHHLAGVFDGREVRAYVDGRQVAAVPAQGPRKPNDLPLFIGADPDQAGRPVTPFAGAIDEVRISKKARYAGAAFVPPARHESDADTVLLLHLDADHGPWTADRGPERAHPRRRGAAKTVVEERPPVR